METMNMPNPAERPKPLGRGGMTVSAQTGQERLLAFWPDTLSDRGVDSYVGKCWRLYSDSMKICQRLHEQNRKQILARASRTEPVLPEVPVRSSLARQEQRRLSELQMELQKISDQAFLQKQNLSPFDYPAGDLCDLFRRQELRQILRESPQQDRMKLVQKYEYRRAMLEQPCEASAMSASLPDRRACFANSNRSRAK
jgi:hypothetical protein